VRYTEVEKALRDLAAAADADRCRRFGADMVVRMTSDADLRDSAEIDLDEDAQQAFAEACADPVNSTGRHLQVLLHRIDAGVLSDTDMDAPLVAAIMALQHWADYLADGDTREIADLAIMSIEEVDHRVPTKLDDFLSTPEMAAEYARITTLLT
jgi:hypothetical protein